MNSTTEYTIPLHPDDIEKYHSEVRETYPLAVARRLNDYQISFQKEYDGAEVAFLEKKGGKCHLDWFRTKEQKLDSQKTIYRSSKKRNK